MSEIFFAPSGSTGGFFEGIEIIGPPGMSMAGYKILMIQGDGTATAHSISSGVVYLALDLGSFSLGTNGLFLWRQSTYPFSSGESLLNFVGPASSTVVHVADFSPDIENGASTFVLGFGVAPPVGSDLDADTDGILDAGALAGFVVVDAVGFADRGLHGAFDDVFGAQLGFVDVGNPNTTGPRIFGGALYRTLTTEGCAGTWLGGSHSGAINAPPIALTGDFFGLPSGAYGPWKLDLGHLNRCFATLTLDNGGVAGQPLSIAISGGRANAFYLTALTFDPNNVGPDYTGIHAGLSITPDELLAEYAIGAAPFVGVLDGSGSMSFVVPALPILGMPLFGASVFFDLTLGAFSGRTQIAAVSL